MLLMNSFSNHKPFRYFPWLEISLQRCVFALPIDDIYSFYGKKHFHKSIWELIFLYPDTFIAPIWYIFHWLRSRFCNILACTSVIRKNEVQHLIFLKMPPFHVKKRLFIDEMRYRKQVFHACTSQQIIYVEFIDKQNKLKYIPRGSKWNWRRIRRVSVRVWDRSPTRRLFQTLTDTRLVGVNGALE